MKISRGDSEERIARLTRSAISVATPHHGTPLANHFLSLQGQTLLLVLSALATSGQGRGAIVAAAQAVALVARLDDWLGRKPGPLDRLADGLLRRIRFDRRDPVWRYLGEIERDQGAVLQLTPEGIGLFDAAVADREGIAYGCVAGRRAEAARAGQGVGVAGPGVPDAARAVPAAARADVAAAPALSVSRSPRPPRSASWTAPWASRSRRPSTTASCRR